MKKIFLQITVFICGASVMIIELVGSRVVAPYLGSSLIAWTTLIGVILAALSFGYWLGGRLADKEPSFKKFGLLILLAALGTALILWLAPQMSQIVPELVASLGVASAAIVSALILFSLPSVLLGMISPYALRLVLHELNQTGRTAGSLYALSTIGSIAGTFLAGFTLIPQLGSFRTLAAVSVILALNSFLFFRRWTGGVMLLIIVTTSFTAFSSPSLYYASAQTLTDQESGYNRLFVINAHERQSGRPITVLMSGPRIAQSAKFSDESDDLVFPYTKFFRLDSYFRPNIKRSLMIGGGAYSVPQDYLKRHSQAVIDVVEIDPLYTEMAREYFGLQDNPRLKIYHEDARTFLEHRPASYDAIFVDAFNSAGSAPFHLATREAVLEMYKALNDGGVIIVNMVTALEGHSYTFVASEFATYQEIFGEARLFPLGNSPEEAQNVMLVAIKNGVWPGNDLAGEAGEFLSKQLENFKTDQRVLTVDWAPVDYFLSGIL